MFPAYGYTNCFPQFYPHNQVPQFMYQNYPYLGVIPPVQNTDGVKAQSNFAVSSGNACSNQSEGNPCHKHNSYPGYGTVFPLHQQFQPFPMHYSGPYPHPNLLPAFYYPSPGYLPEQRGKNHCCGCLNHNCQRQDSYHVSGTDDQKSSGQKLGDCFQSLPTNAYQMICAPKGNSNNVAEDVPTLNFMQPNSWKAWVPLEALPHKGIEPAGEMGNKDKQQNEGKMERSFPIIWMPSHHRPEQAEKAAKEIQPSPRIEEVPSCNVKIIPVKQSDRGNPDDNGVKGLHDEEAQDDAIHSKKMSTKKTIPVQHVVSAAEKHVSAPEKPDNEAVKFKNNEREIGNEKSMGNSHSERKPSPVKSAKLPPVCLRVDPLPKNKKKNGSPRLSSQLGQKNGGGTDKTEKQSPGKETDSAALKKEMKVAGNDVEGNKQDFLPLVHETDNSMSEVKERSDLNEKRDNPDQSVQAAAVSLDNSKHSGTGCDFEEADQTEGKLPGSSSGNPSLENVKVLPHLSDADAAIIIQSVYRGFEVRKWQPIKKLKQIRAVRHKVADIKDKINNLKTYSGESLDSKSMVFLGEAIMNLLLELDTIQALHPSAREIRKSVARELVCLQKQLDLLKKMPIGIGAPSNNCEGEQTSDLEKAEINGPAASAAENSFFDTQFLVKEDTVPCTGQGDSKQLEYDHPIGNEDGSSEKKIAVDLQSFGKDFGHLSGGTADASVEEDSCADAGTIEAGRVPATDESVVCSAEADSLAGSQSRSKELEYSPKFYDDTSTKENGCEGSCRTEVLGPLSEGEKGTCTEDPSCSLKVHVYPDSSMVDESSSQAQNSQVKDSLEVHDDASWVENGYTAPHTEVGLLQEDEKESCTKDLDFSCEIQIHPGTSVVNDAPVGPKPDEAPACLANPSTDNQPVMSEKAEDKGKEYLSSEMPDSEVAALGIPSGCVLNDISAECNCPEQPPLVMLSEQGEEVQVQETKQSPVHLVVESGQAKEEEKEEVFVGDALPVKDNAQCTDTKWVEQLLFGKDLHEGKEDEETCILEGSFLPGMLDSEHLNADHGVSEKDKALPANSSVAATHTAVALGSSEAITQGNLAESCLPPEEFHSENDERPRVGGSLSVRDNSDDFKKWQEQEEGIRTMLNKLLEAGQKQMQVMSDLSDRVDHLERRLSQRRRLRLKKRKGITGATVAALNPSNNSAA